MAIFNPMPAPAIFRHFTHRGWLGLCPVYENDWTADLAERNGVPEWWFDVNVFAIEAVKYAAHLLGIALWPEGWPVLRTGRIGTGAVR